MAFKFILAAIILFTGTLSAAPCFDHPLSLSELIDIALENNPETRQAWWSARRAAAALGSAKSGYYPQIDFQAYVEHGRDFKFINGPDVNYTQAGTDLILSMVLFDFGERQAGVTSAKMTLLSANWQTDFTLQKVMVNVLENAYMALYYQDALDAYNLSLKEAEKMVKSGKDLNQSGLKPISDVYTYQATLAQLQMDVAHQKALLDIQKGKLAASLGFSADTDIPLAPIGQLPIPQQTQTGVLIALAKEQRADLMAKRAKLSASLADLEKSRTAYYPKISLTSRAGSDHDLHDKAHGAHYRIGLNFEMPLFDGFDTAYRNRMAYADSQITEEELARLELEIALEVLTRSRTLEEAQETLGYAADNLKNAQQAFEAVVDKYSAGKEGIAEVSNTQRQLALARVRYSEVKTKWLVSIANLAYATGTLAPYMESSCTNNP